MKSSKKFQQNRPPLKNTQQQAIIQALTKQHQAKAQIFFVEFQKDLTKKIEDDLKDIHNALNLQLGRTIRLFQHKLRGKYSTTLSRNITPFLVSDFVKTQVKQVQKAMSKLKQRIYLYVNEYCETILKSNINKTNSVSLFHSSNQIDTFQKNWQSVTSRSPLLRAQICVKGFHRPQTTWLALGISHQMKQCGPIKGTFNQQDFMGNIYLNGTDDISGGYRIRRDLTDHDIFVVECQNRMMWVYRKQEGKNKKETFIMNDNIDYYIYIAFKGPIKLQFIGQG